MPTSAALLAVGAVLATAALAAAAPSALAQPGTMLGGQRAGNVTSDPTGGFTFARLKYTGGGDWYSDETSLRNILNALRARGDVRVAQDREAVVTPSDPALFNYPMIFMTGHGNVKLNDDDVRSLRRYLDQGGFLWADDNFGLDTSFRALVQRLYPETQLVELPFSHPIFHYPNSFTAGAPKVHEHDGGPARVFAVMSGGRMTVLYTFDTDIGNGTEDAGIYDDPQAKRDAAMRFAVNIATYVVTH